jgi:hypothetical protein
VDLKEAAIAHFSVLHSVSKYLGNDIYAEHAARRIAELQGLGHLGNIFDFAGGKPGS